MNQTDTDIDSYRKRAEFRIAAALTVEARTVAVQVEHTMVGLDASPPDDCQTAGTPGARRYILKG
jgi:hypothetical protein